MGVEISRAFDGLLLGCCERSEEGGDVCFHGGVVVASKVDGVAPPAFVEVPGSLDGFCVVAGVCEGNFVASVVSIVALADL